MFNDTKQEVRRINEIIRRNNLYYWTVYGPASFPAPHPAHCADRRPRFDPTEGC